MERVLGPPEERERIRQTMSVRDECVADALFR